MKSNLATTTTLADAAAVTLLSGLLCLATAFAVGQSVSSGANAMQIQKMLTDRELWGADAFALFAGLQRWKNAGESSILVFPDRVVGGNKYDSPAAAEPSASRLSAVMKAAPPKLRPEYQAAYRQSLSRAASFKIRTERFLEDDSFHLVMRREAGEFLKPDIPMRIITDRYGKPEKTTTEVVHAQGDRRPAVLTVHWYAGGAIKFVQSDLSPRPETVDRVVIDVNAIASQLY
jgi:hypothetical protein